MDYRSLEGMIRDVISEGLIQEASLGDSKGLMALARRKTGDEKDVMNRAADMMKKGQIKDLNMFMKAMDDSTHKAIMPFIDKKYNKALHEDLEEAVEMCSEECCGLPVTECTCAPDCEHCDCNKINEDEQQDEARGYGEADTHIIMQLRSAQDLGGKKDITFRGGAKAQVDKKHIDKILKLHDHPALKPVQKRQMRVAISKSPKHLASFASKLKEDYDTDNVDSILSEDIELDEAQYKVPSNYAAMMQKKKRDISQQMADKAKKDNISTSDKDKLKKLSSMMKKANEEGFANPAQQAAVMSKLKASGKYKKEEADLDEISKKTLGSYIKKATNNATSAARVGKDFDRDAKSARSPLKKASNQRIARDFHNIATKRKSGIGKAVDKLTKEEADLDETKGAPKGYHFTRSGQLKKGDANQDGDGGAMLRSDPLDKQRKKIPALPESDEGAPEVSTPRADYKLGKVRMPDGKMVYRKVKKQVDIEK